MTNIDDLDHQILEVKRALNRTASETQDLQTRLKDLEYRKQNSSPLEKIKYYLGKRSVTVNDSIEQGSDTLYFEITKPSSDEDLAYVSLDSMKIGWVLYGFRRITNENYSVWFKKYDQDL